MTDDISLFDAMYAQRAIRRFKPDPVPQEAIERILEAAVRAPSGGNRQSWSFIVIRDPEIKAKFGEWYLDSWGSSYVPGLGKTTSTPIMSSAEYLAHHLAETPVLILGCVQRSKGRLPGLSQWGTIFPAIQNLMLAALSLGLGTVLTTMHFFHEAEAKELLGIPEEVDTACLIPLGYPAEGEHFGGARRRPIADVTHYDRWGQGRPKRSFGPRI
ncbi:MAG: Nitroreductase [Chloroflexi bacterium]|jgi:nitroreductase|nr:MAG: Nitroreductase [Chloroflexota bacterium]